MNTEKLLRIVALELTTDLTKLELELENVINSDKNVCVNAKAYRIKQLLAKIVQTEASIMKFNQMTAQPENNENNKN
jgi:hypothetical protein